MSDGDLPLSHPSTSTLSPAVSVACPECRSTFSPSALGPHLRDAHQYQYFHSVWRSPAATIADALTVITSSQPDQDAWQALVTVAREQHGSSAASFLASSLGKAIERLSEDERGPVIAAIAVILANAEGNAAELAAALASDDNTAAHHLALSLLARLSPPLRPLLFQPAQALLLDRRLPADDQLVVAALLLRSVPPDDPRATDFLQTLVGGLGKARSIERLRELERRAGRHLAIDTACARLEERLRMTCPRCDVAMRRPEMIRHLWEEHRLVLDGRRVREPMNVIEDWIEAYLARPDPDLLARCRTLIRRLDPEHGLTKIHRLFLKSGIADSEARTALSQEAMIAHATLCPACFVAVPIPREISPFTISERDGRLTSHGYSVEVREKGLLTRVEVRTPTNLVYRDREPRQQLTTNGAVILFVGPLVLIALAAAITLPHEVVLSGVVALLALAFAVYGFVLVRWRVEMPAATRARNYAWTLLAPRLHAAGFVSDDAAFLAGLADACAGDGYGRLRMEFLPDLLTRTERALIRGQAPPGFLAPLLRLAVEDATAGSDPIPMVVGELARCFEGELPLALAERLLADWRANWWTEGNLSRLRILLCDRAFAAGFEVSNLIEAGQNSPALADVLGTDDPHRLAALRLLWSLRATQPWERCGDAKTVFEVAENIGYASLLAQHPDLLLYQEEPQWQLVADGGKGKLGPARILVLARGVCLQEVVFETPPQTVEVRSKLLGIELVLGERRFRGPYPLDEMATRMERWFRFVFYEFLPRTSSVIHWKPPDRTAVLRAQGTLLCPECGIQMQPRVGEIGVRIE